jgi:uncharacterized protein YqhQ
MKNTDSTSPNTPTDASEMNALARLFDMANTHVSVLIYAVITICAGLLATDVFVHKHGHFAFEEWIGFFPLFGFASYCFIVLTAKQLRKLIGRNENYY